MDTVDVVYYINKAGTYVQFSLPVHTRELGELNAYESLLKQSIRKNFGGLFDTYGMDFASESAYLVSAGDEAIDMVVCLLGKTDPELERSLARLGIRRGE